jgi:probable HAF family extracellular repeat protein
MRRSALLLVLVFSVPRLSQADWQVFKPLRDLPGGGIYSDALAISGDARTIVGVGTSIYGRQTVVWIDGEGPNLLTGVTGSPVALSHDGTVVAGNGPAFRAVDGVQIALGTPPNHSSTFVRGVSADGSVVVGFVDGPGSEAFRWTANQGFEGLDDLPGGNFLSSAYAISADASTVVGQGFSEDALGESRGEAFRYRDDIGMVGLGFLPGDNHSLATAVSANGSVVAGLSVSGSGLSRPFRWTETTGMVELGAGYSASSVTGMSADGSVVVGIGGPCGSGIGSVLVWNTATGDICLYDELLSAGAETVRDWKLYLVGGISANGTTIVGQGINPDGEQEAWMARVPEPSSPVSAFAVILTLRVVARSRRPWRAVQQANGAGAPPA